MSTASEPGGRRASFEQEPRVAERTVVSEDDRVDEMSRDSFPASGRERQARHAHAIR
jgi:hypothetical protein